jgi:hypothetical protein
VSGGLPVSARPSSDIRLDTLAALRALEHGDQEAYDLVVCSSDDPAGMLLTALRLCRLVVDEWLGPDNVCALVDRLVVEEYATEPSL